MLFSKDDLNKSFSIDKVYNIYNNFNTNLIKELESLGYLENYLWPNYNINIKTKEYIFSILCLINEKIRQKLSVFDIFNNDKPKFSSLFQNILSLGFNQENFSISERIVYICFLQNIFQCLEDDLINSQVLRLISLPTWSNINDSFRNHILSKNKRLLKQWRHFEKLQNENKQKTKKQKLNNNNNKMDIDIDSDNNIEDEYYYEKNFMWILLNDFNTFITSLSESPEPLQILYCEKFIEWIKDLLAQLPTRRYFKILLQASFLLPTIKLSPLLDLPNGRLFHYFVNQLEYYFFFHIDDFTGVALTNDEIIERHYERIQSLQVIAYKYFSPTLRPFALRNVGSIEKRTSLRANLVLLNPEDLHKLGEYLFLIDKNQDISTEILLETIILLHEERSYKLSNIIEQPIYPNELNLWNNNLKSLCDCYGIYCYGLPKINLQFLSIYDYLYRNFILYQQEASYLLKNDIEDIVKRIKPRLSEDETKTIFKGWARMSSGIAQFSLDNVQKPKIGENIPSSVTGNIIIHLSSMRPDIKEEWKNIKENSILYLVKITSPIKHNESPDSSLLFPDAFGIQVVRGCKVIQVIDSKGRIVGIDDTLEKKLERKRQKEYERKNPHPRNRYMQKQVSDDVLTDKRTFKVSLDPQQYYLDLKNDIEYIYEENTSFNIVIRRESSRNIYTNILHSIRNMMKEDHFIFPEWFTDVFLGYGDPLQSLKLNNNLKLNVQNTFIDYDHIKESFPDYNILFDKSYKLNENTLFNFEINNDKKSINVIPYNKFNQDNIITSNNNNNENKKMIRFTRNQSNSIISSMNEGIHIIKGPSNSGKKHIISQIIQLLYSNYNNQRTLIISHSNNGLDNIFNKINDYCSDIDQRYILKLYDENEKYYIDNNTSNIDYLLNKRLDLLKKVQILATSLSHSIDVAQSCETAELFFKHTISNIWNRFLHLCSEDTSNDSISVHFPFSDFIINLSTKNKGNNNNNINNLELFSKDDINSDMKKAQCYFNYIKDIFLQLDEIRPFELLQDSNERNKYLLIKQSKIIGITCNYISNHRQDLLDLGFCVDNIIINEASQLLDIQSFISLSCRPKNILFGHSLKRIIMFGDNNQLSPNIHNSILLSYSNFNQSLFKRFTRLGLPSIFLDKQIQSRSSLLNLFKWKYSYISDLSLFNNNPLYSLCNSGFLYDYQFINISDSKEQETLPQYYQNIIEAEYIVSVYQYMRLLGYSSSSISIITSYTGQRDLILDILRNKCENNYFLYPKHISTIDDFQGQQNDYILFSMVRTESIGNMNDIGRFIVSISCARLGLYIFGKLSLFSNSKLLKPTFNILEERSTTLQLIPTESYPSSRKINDKIQSIQVNNLSQIIEITSKLAESKFKGK